jgi:hypothetical protein
MSKAFLVAQASWPAPGLESGVGGGSPSSAAVSKVGLLAYRAERSSAVPLPLSSTLRLDAGQEARVTGSALGFQGSSWALRATPYCGEARH